VVFEIGVLIALTRKVRDGSGVLVKSLCSLERGEAIVSLRDASPMVAFLVVDDAART
jgi:hypothetical protein